jgi:hypothetical protein
LKATLAREEGMQEAWNPVSIVTITYLGLIPRDMQGRGMQYRGEGAVTRRCISLRTIVIGCKGPWIGDHDVASWASIVLADIFCRK